MSCWRFDIQVQKSKTGSDLGDPPRVSASYWSAPKIQKKTAVVVWAFSCFFCSLACFRQARPSCWVCTPSDSPWLTVRRCSWRQRFPEGAPPRQAAASRVKKHPTLLTLWSAHSCASPALGNQTQMFLTAHQSTNKFTVCLFVCSPDSPLIQPWCHSAVMFGRMLCFIFISCTLSHLNFEVWSLCCWRWRQRSYFICSFTGAANDEHAQEISSASKNNKMSRLNSHSVRKISSF